MNKPVGEDEGYKKLIIEVRLGDACMDEAGVANVLDDVADEIRFVGVDAYHSFVSVDGNRVAELEWR